MTGAETIFAPASGAGRAAIAVIRVSGPAADTALSALTARTLPEPRRAVLRRLIDTDGALIDEALVIRFAEGASHTGEAMAEIHCHGGRAVVSAVLAALGRVPGLRLAEPGEFALRAVQAGRMTLADAEALGDLVDAETEAQRRAAARRVGGALDRVAESWRERLTDALALIEATIDWADEEVPERVEPAAGRLARSVLDEIRREIVLSGGAERLRTGFEVALIGAPNAGKSSLLNALAGREAAITAPEPGTTRDVVELRYDLEGLPVTFLDMAGLRDGATGVEAIGIDRARSRAAAADLRVLVAAPDAPADGMAGALRRDGDIRVASKADLGSGEGLAISARDGTGIPALLAAIADRLAACGSDGLVAHARQRAQLEAAAGHLESALAGLDSAPAELVSEDLRSANRALEALIGRIGTEAVLGAVFARFCLGK